MNKEGFINQVLEACSLYAWEFEGIYKHYELVSITQNLVRVSVISWGFDSGYAEVIDFQNDQDLIDDMLNVL
jgi:hypothetical protein